MEEEEQERLEQQDFDYDDETDPENDDFDGNYHPHQPQLINNYVNQGNDSQGGHIRNVTNEDLTIRKVDNTTFEDQES